MPIIPDEAGPSAWTRCSRSSASTPRRAGSTSRSTTTCCSRTRSPPTGRSSKRASARGGLSSWTAAATSYATRGVPIVPFFTFYSMFGFQRVGDLIWATANAHARGFLMGATADAPPSRVKGSSTRTATACCSPRPCRCAARTTRIAFETAVIIDDGIHRMYPDGDATRGEDLIYYITLYNENYPMPALPEVVQGVVNGLYRYADAPEGPALRATILFSGTSYGATIAAQAELAEHYGVGAELWSTTSYQQLRTDTIDAQRWNRLHPDQPARPPLVTQELAGSRVRSSQSPTTLRAVPDQIARWVPRRWNVLGTDGFGRSDRVRRCAATSRPTRRTSCSQCSAGSSPTACSTRRCWATRSSATTSPPTRRSPGTAESSAQHGRVERQHAGRRTPARLSRTPARLSRTPARLGRTPASVLGAIMLPGGGVVAPGHRHRVS